MSVDAIGRWSPWFLLEDAGRNANIPMNPGLYRIRRPHVSGLDYVGQTSNLRGRMSMLRGVYGEIIPYNDPHTAAPGLWVIRQSEASAFEVSVIEIPGDVVVRKGLECLLITEHRIEHRRSPTVNFGRMPEGWIKSKGGSTRFRGRPDPEALRIVDAAAPKRLDQPVRSSRWLGFNWFEQSPPMTSVGVYRCLRSGGEGLVYIGQGRIADRIKGHQAKTRIPEHSQAGFFSGDLTWEWAELGDAHRTQLLEIENDLIASHVLVCGRPPEAQFQG